MDEDETEPVDWHAPELERARDEIQAGINRYARELARQRNDDEPLVVAWVAGWESTSVRLEQSDKAARDAAVPTSQSISASLGLGSWLHDRW